MSKPQREPTKLVPVPSTNKIPERDVDKSPILEARHLGIEDRVGSIEPGKDADLVLMDGSFLQVESRVKAVYLDGCDLMEN